MAIQDSALPPEFSDGVEIDPLKIAEDSDEQRAIAADAVIKAANAGISCAYSEVV